MLVAVVEPDTLVNKPGINPDALTNVNTDPSIVVATNVP
jgi:hypothetical protein